MNAHQRRVALRYAVIKTERAQDRKLTRREVNTIRAGYVVIYNQVGVLWIKRKHAPRRR